MLARPHRFALSASLLLLSIAGAAQTAYRVSPREVTIDVSVRDASNAFIGGLKAQDFHVRDDGKPQDVSLKIAAATPEDRRLVLLVDSRGTTANVLHAFADSVSKAIAAKPAMPVMVAAMNESSVTIRVPFTTDRAAIVAGLQDVPTIALVPEGIRELEKQMTGGTGNRGRDAGEIARVYLDQLDTASKLTEKGMVHFMALLGTYPGRKDVIYVNDSYPLAAARRLRSSLPATAARGERGTPVRDQLREVDLAVPTTNIATAANQAGVTIYPVDWRSTGVEDSLRSGVVQQESLRPGYVKGEGQPETTSDLLAQLTGGFLVVYPEDLTAGLARVVQESGDYYLLTFPVSEDKKSKVHRMEVKVDRADAHVLARRVYTSGVSEEQMFNAAMAAAMDLPDGATAIPFASRAIAANGLVKVDLNIPIDHVTFVPKGAGQHVDLILIGMVTREDGSRVGAEYQIKRPYSLTLNPQQYAAARQQNIVGTHNEFPLSKGEYYLTLLLRDSTTGAIGATRQKLSVP